MILIYYNLKLYKIFKLLVAQISEIHTSITRRKHKITKKICSLWCVRAGRALGVVVEVVDGDAVRQVGRAGVGLRRPRRRRQPLRQIGRAHV